MKLLWFGDSADTGFGTVTWNVCTRLLAQGVDVRIFSDNVVGNPVPHPLGERTWDIAQVGLQTPRYIMSGFDDGWKPDAIVVLGDYAAARGNVLGHPTLTKAFSSVPTFHYCPIEGVGLPPGWNDVWEVIHPVAMSEFGADEIAKVTGSRPPVIYHGVSTDDFYPVAPNRPGYVNAEAVTSKEQAKRAIHFEPDRIMVLRTDRHMPRKRYNSMIRAFGRVFAENPLVDLVIHCQPHDQGGNLWDAISKLPEEHRTRVKLTRGHTTFKGYSKPILNVLYNAADIYASTSAEGFGLTIAEAMAARVPVVAMDYSAVPEVVGDAGILVPYRELVDNEYDHFWATIDEDAFADAILRLAAKPALRRSLGSQGPLRIASKFRWDTAAEQFAALVSPIREEIAA
jgi:glycosyltransferase involved in cell wall biosynthesis